MNGEHKTWQRYGIQKGGPALVAFLLAISVGCTPQGGGTIGGGDGDGTTDGTAFLNDALGYGGSVSGKIVDTQSTRASIDNTSSAQEVPSEIDTENTTVMFQDVLGNELLDENGEPIAEVPLNPDGTFEADDLPVGVDFTVCADIGNDGTCDVQSCINIPSTDGGPDGELSEVQVDPLTTLVLAKLHELIEQKGIDPLTLPISPVALVTRVVEAYKHLYEETGIEHEVTLEDIENLSTEGLADLFDSVIPSGAQAGMDVVGGNLDLAVAEDENAVALAAAKVFLYAGFPIADQPEGLDLSSLGALDGIETATFQEFQAIRHPNQDQLAVEDTDAPTEPEAAQDGAVRFEPTIYFNTGSEPDRNFSEDESSGDQQGGPRLPLIHDYLLIEMARLQLEGRRITLGALTRVLSSIDDGMGARFSYFVHDPNFFGPPLNIFETADGAGKAVNIQELFQQFADRGFQNLTREEVEARESELRTLLTELLDGTTEPDLQRLAGGFITDVVGTAEELSTRIRDARAHLPFSRTGPSTFFVVADGDPFRTDATVSPISVDAELDTDGDVLSVTFNATGEGKFYLGFTQRTQGEGIVSLHVRETGRPVHGRMGPARLSINDAAIFQSVNGGTFADFVSDTGNFFPGIPVAIVSSEFVPEPAPTDAATTPDVEAAAVDTAAGPNQQIFVLATAAGPGAEAVRVDYDPTLGTATFNIGGSYLLQFLPETHDTGVFALFNEKAGRPARDEDPANFFEQPMETPDGIEEIFNDTDGFTDVEGVMDQLPPDVVIPPAADTTEMFGGEVNALGQILISIDSIVGLPVTRETFTNVFGTEVSNPRYNADGDPYYDDLNADEIQDADEPTSPHRPVLFNGLDWRSTDIRLYYRRSDNNAAVTFEEVDFMSDTPQTMDGVTLVPRNYVPRLNAFRFGRPNTAINLLTAFLPPEFFNGTFGFKEETPLDVFAAIAMINLMMDQVHNVEANVDIDGIGPLAAVRTVINANIFIAPIGDPFVLLVKGFTAFAEVVAADPADGATDDTLGADATVEESDAAADTTTVTKG